MGVNRVKNNCTSGELDPLLHSRADIKQWANGLRTARNVRLLPQGGFRRRDGSELLSELLPVISLIANGVTVTTPNGGTPPSPDEDPTDPWYSDRDRCVTGDMWLTPSLQAKDVTIGSPLTVVEKDWSIVEGPVTALKFGREKCWRVTSSSGAIIECSRTTPFTLRDGVAVLPGALLTREVLVEQADGHFEWEVVVGVTMIGERDVYKITVGDRSYAAGVDPRRRIVSHNIYNKP